MSSEPIEDNKKTELTPLAGGKPALCPRCGAKLNSSFAACWLCLGKPEAGNSVKADSPATHTDVADNASISNSDAIFATILAVCAVIAILIGLSLTIQSPGLLVPYLFLLGPILIASAAHGTQQVVSTGRIQPRGLFNTVMIASLTVFALIAAFIVACFIFLFVICMPLLQSGGH